MIPEGRMKRLPILSIVMLVLLISSDAYAEITGNVNLLPGFKVLEGGVNAWDNVRFQTELIIPGVEANFRGATWPVSINLAYHNTAMSTWLNLITAPLGVLSMEYGQTQEFDLGVRKIWESAPHVRPYIGAGGSYIRGYMQKTLNFAWAPDVDYDLFDSSGGWGGYVEAGVYWEIVKHLNIGLGASWSMAELKFSGKVIDADPTSTRGDVTVDGGGLKCNFILGFHY
jgi:hypothetical protein